MRILKVAKSKVTYGMSIPPCLSNNKSSLSSAPSPRLGDPDTLRSENTPCHLLPRTVNPAVSLVFQVLPIPAPSLATFLPSHPSSFYPFRDPIPDLVPPRFSMSYLLVTLIDPNILSKITHSDDQNTLSGQ